MSGKHIKNISLDRQAFQTANLEDLSDGFVKSLLRYAQSKFEVFGSELVKKAAKYIIENGITSKVEELLDGYPVIDYLICTSVLLASLFDSEAVVASGLLLYDSLCDKGREDCLVGLNFGSEVAGLVKDVLKLRKPSGISREEEQRNSEHIQDSILNMVQNDRAVTIKIALRTVQMILLDRFNPKRKQSLVKETLDVYVPLLERLDFSLWKTELENLCASTSDHELMELYESVCEYDADGIAFTDKLKKAAAHKDNLYFAGVEFHKRSLHSIRNKMSRKNITFSEIRVIICLRITTVTVDECYRAKAVVEKVWNAEPKFEKDYIKCPKANGYKSLHVIVKNAKDQYMKVHISTAQMQFPFFFGLHWAYKDRDVHVPLENVKLLVEIASRIEKQAEKCEFLCTGIFDFLSDVGLGYEVLKSELVQRAAKFASRKQKEKELLDGYPVIEHLNSTAIHLASSFNSDIVVASGFLIHGSLAGTKPEYEELKKEFGKEVAKLVRDVSKLSKLSKISRKEPLENAKLLPDFILAMGMDARAVAIKIAECIVQMTVLDKLNLEKKGFMNEILCVYVPLSERLGLSSWKSQLENLCKYADDEVKNADDEVKEAYESVSDKDKDGNEFKDKLEKALERDNFPFVRVEFRKKSLLSILKKMSKKEQQQKMSNEEQQQKQRQKMSEVDKNDVLENIKDILGMRIIIEDKENEAKEDVRKRCNAAKDVVANLWTVEYVKDFFKNPNNGYESLHVIVKNPNNHYMEVQIRTIEMHEKIDGGHWLYKEGKSVPQHVKMLVDMARFSINQELKVPVYVLVEDENKVTKIEVQPAGTQLKDLCRGLKGQLWGRVLVNEEYASQNYTLKMGDIIEIQPEKE